MFEQAFKNIDDVLEHDKATVDDLDGKKYTPILDKPYRWESWAAPKGKDGKIDHNTAQTGDDLIQFVNGKLFPDLHGFKAKATGPNTIEYKIGEIFGETICDPAVGSAGFLCESFDYLRAQNPERKTQTFA